MTAPTVAGTSTTDGSTAAVDPAVNIGSPSAGQLVIVFFTSTSTHSAPTVPSGWTYLVSAKPGGDTRSGDRDQCFYKVASGSEGATVTVDTGTSSVKYSAIAYRITGHDSGQAPEISTAAVGTSTTPNATTVTPTGGSKDYLFLTWAVHEGTGSVGTAPSGYSNRQSVLTSGGGGATNSGNAVAEKAATASSEDAGAWGAWGASEDWVAWTVAVHPSTAENHDGTFVVTGGGVITAAETTNRNRSGSLVGGGIITQAKTTNRNRQQLLTGGGILTQAETTARNLAQLLTGGGVLVVAGDAGGPEEHDGTFVVTGGGVLVAAQLTNRNRQQLLTGAGVLVVNGQAGRQDSAILTGGGVVNWIEATGRLAAIQLTGGGQLLFVGGQDVALSDLGAVMCAMGDALEAADVAAGRVFCYPPDSVDAPATVIGYPTTIEFDAAMMRGADRLVIPVYYLTGRTSDRAAQQKIAGIITGANGIKDVLDGNLGGVVQTLRVQDMRVLRVDLAGVEYLSAVFNAEVFV